MIKSHPLIGLFAFISSENYYKYGKIIDYIDDEFFLIQMYFEESKIKSFSLYAINQMISE